MPSTSFNGEETLAQIIEVGLAGLFAKLHEMLVAFFADPLATWETHALEQLNAVHQYVVAVLLGTNTLTYGDKTLEDFAWSSVGTDTLTQYQKIIEVGSDGCSLRLGGLKVGDAWQFWVEADEGCLNGLIENGDLGLTCDDAIATTWRGALKQLDHYPWTQITPLFVHPEFQSKVSAALKVRQKKGLSMDVEKWGGVLMEEFE